MIFTRRYLLGESNLLIKMEDSIHEALLKFKLEEDIIVYRNDNKSFIDDEMIHKFLSTSVTKNGTLKKSPNMSIIVPKGTVGAYIGDYSLFPKQREFLLDGRNKLEKIAEVDGKIIYEVKK